MATIQFQELSILPAVSTGSVNEELIYIWGETTATGGSVPSVGVLTRLINSTADAVYGNQTDGTLPSGLKAIREQFPQADIVACRTGTGFTNSQAIAKASEVSEFASKNLTRMTTNEKMWNETGGSIQTTTYPEMGTLNSKCDQLKVTGYVPAPNGTRDEAIAWAGNNTSDRLNGIYGSSSIAGSLLFINGGAALCGVAVKEAVNRGILCANELRKY